MKRALLFSLIVLTSACATTRIERDPMASVAPAMSVEAFLQAANANDYQSMAELFGTPDGPVANTGSTFGCAFKKMGSWFGLGDSCTKRYEVELRMSAIAHLLRHEDYRLSEAGMVPGRPTPTRRVAVNLTQDGREIAGVPFTVVRSGDDRWLVQEIGLETITSATVARR